MHEAPSAVVLGGFAGGTGHGELGERLHHQLERIAADVRRVDQEAPAGWLALADLLAGSTGPVGIVDAAYVGHLSPLADTLADSRWGSARLYDGDEARSVVRIAPADLPAAEEAARELAAGGVALGVARIAERLADAGVEFRPVDVGPYVAGLASDAGTARELVERAELADEHRLRLIASARPGDGFYSTFVVRRIARHVTAGALRLGLRPDTITIVSLLVGLAAAACFAVGDRWALVAGAVLLQVSLVIDCADGEVARYTLRFSAFGAWLDAVSDRVKEFAAYAGLAIGAARAGMDLWVLAGATMAVLVVRHHVDFGFAIRQESREGAAPHDDLAASPLGRAGRAAAELSERTNQRAAQLWAKRVVIMPIGERWLIISVVAASWDARAVFVTLIVTGVVAAAYTTFGRVLRSAAERVPVGHGGRRQIGLLSDAPGLVRADPPAPWLGSRLAWLVPALSRLAEFAAVLVVAAVIGGSAPEAAYMVLAIVALRLYDLVYRLRHLPQPPARWAAVGALGAIGRVAVLAGAGAAGMGVFVVTCVVVASAVLAVSAVEARSAWTTHGKDGGPRSTAPRLGKVSS